MTATDRQPDVLVRTAYAEDALAIHRIIDEVAATGAVLPRAIEDIDLWIESFVVGTVNGEVVACAALNTVGAPRIGEIRSVAVSAAARATGLGRALIEYLIDEAHSLGLERLFLLTRVPAFFEKCGFRTIEVEHLPDSFLADLVHVQKRSLFNKFVMTRDIELLSGFADSPTLDASDAKAARRAARARTRAVQPRATPEHATQHVA